MNFISFARQNVGTSSLDCMKCMHALCVGNFIRSLCVCVRALCGFHWIGIVATRADEWERVALAVWAAVEFAVKEN